jgi:hypothetical protein
MTDTEPMASYVCRLVRDTPAAVLVAEIANPGIEHWLPRAQIRIEEGADGRLRIFMPLALAHRKGLLTAPNPAQGRLL